MSERPERWMVDYEHGEGEPQHAVLSWLDEEAKGLPEVGTYLVRAAALVDSEAREREYGRTKERLRERLQEAHERAERAEAGEAVLVEALKEIGALARREWDRAPTDAIAAILKAAEAAGVVEAEPDGSERCD